MKVKEFFSVRKYAFLSALITAIFAYFIFSSAGLLQSGEYIFLHDDLWAIYPAFIRYFWEALFGAEPINYSFYVGMGMPMHFMYANVLSPFNIIVLLIQDNNIAFGIITIVKLATAAYCFARLVAGRLKYSELYSCVFGVSYALCAYSLIFYYNIIFLDSLYILPILVELLLNLIQKKRFRHMVLGLFYTFLLGYYQGYILGITLAVTTIVVMTFLYHCPVKEILKALFLLFLAAIIATLMSAAIIVPSIYATLVNIPTVNGEPISHNLSVGQFFNSFLFWKGQNQDSASPAMYTGLFVLILSMGVFFTSKVTARKKITYGVMFLILIFISFNAYGYYFIHMFDMPDGSHYRYAYLFSFLFCICATEYTSSIKMFQKKIIKFLIVTCVLGEVLYAGIVIEKSQDRGTFETEEMYATWKTEIPTLVSQTKATDKGLYRFKYENVLQANDSLYFKYPGLYSFNTIQNEKVRTINQKLGYGSSVKNLTDYGGSPVTEMLYAQKYIIKNERNDVNGDAKCIPNEFSLPMVYSSSDKIKDVTLPSENGFLAQNELLSAVLGYPVQVFSPIDDGVEISLMNAKLAQTESGFYFELDDESTPMGSISYIKASDMPLYAQFIPTQYAIVNGAPEVFGSNEFGEIFKTGLYTGAIRKMRFTEDGTYQISIAMLENSVKCGEYRNMLVYTYNKDALRKAYEELSLGQLEHVSYENGVIRGDIEIDENHPILMTSIPYEKGWKIFVDGVKVPTYAVAEGTFLAADILPGHHDIEMYYVDELFLKSVILSIISVIAYIVTFFFKKRPLHKSNV